jgi:glycerol kinase
VYAIVQIFRGDRSQRFVVETNQAQRFPQILLEFVDGFQLGSQGGLFLATWGQEELLKSAIDQFADATRHEDASPLHHSGRGAGEVLQHGGAAVPAHRYTAAAGWGYGETCFPQVLHALVKGDLLRMLPPEKHSAPIIMAPMGFILSLDEGTTSARAALYDEAGRVVSMESTPIACGYPHPGWVEQDAREIWRSQLDATRRLIEKTGIRPRDIVAAGITNQRETTIVWERSTGQPVAPAIVWQCRRTADYCAELAASLDGPPVTAATGLVIDAYFSASKIRWILEHTPEARSKARDGELLFGTVDTWLIWNLTAGAVHVTDPSNASRTMLMNLRTGKWDDDLLRIFDVPRAMLPAIRPSSGMVGTTTAFGAEIPITGIAGDQQAALAGQACFRAGLSKNTYGTGCFALLHTGERMPVSKHRLLATRAASTGAANFAIEGSVFIAGAAVQWLRDKLGLIATASDSEALAVSVADNDGVYLVPAFVGLGAPHWDSGARGLLTGITAATSQAHIVRAALESIAYQVRELVAAMEADSGERLSELRVDGGAAVNNFLMQFQADILGRPIVRPVDIETTALGAAYLAGLACGFWKSVAEIESFWRADRRFEPQMDSAVRERLFGEWKSAVSRCRSN